MRAELEGHRSVSQMTAAVLHDINTPLGIINQAASLIADGLRPKGIEALARDEDAHQTLVDLADAAQLILRSAERARNLVESFKAVTVRQLRPQSEELPFGALVREIVGLYRLKARSSNLAIEVRGLERDDQPWRGYPGFLSQVVLNLLTNVDRYAYPAGEGGRVEVDVGASGDSFQLSVTDHGAGMAPEVLDKIFQPFFTTGADRGGTGLGMSIVRDLTTNRLGGTIAIESAPGRGTSIKLRLPRSVIEDET